MKVTQKKSQLQKEFTMLNRWVITKKMRIFKLKRMKNYSYVNVECLKSECKNNEYE